MRKRNAVNLCEGYTVELVGEEEHTVANILELEVRTKFVFIHRILCLLRLVGIITPVPPHGFEVLAFLADFCLDVLEFFVCLLHYRGPHLVEERTYSFCSLCHACFESECSIVVVAHELCLLDACFYKATNHLLVVILIAVVATVGIAFIHLLTEVAIFSILKERHYTRVVKREEPLALLTSSGCRFGSVVNEAFGKTSEVLFILNKELESVGFSKHVLTESELKE